MSLFVLIIMALLWWPVDSGSKVPWPPAAPVSPAGEGTVQLPYYRMPARLALCGEQVPLEDQAVREALDREFTIVVWSRAQTTMWLKRAHRYFPYITKKLKDHHLPQDLKYVAVIESDLRDRAFSRAGAAGPWQFMAPTALRFQLKANDQIDERLDFGAATDAALRYLKALRQQLGNWPLALAAYNCGEGRVLKEMAAQGVSDYYRLALPEETERYVFRLLAAKVVLENPKAYGFEIPAEELYEPLEYEVAQATLTGETPVRTLAWACGSYYKAFKTLNPWIKGAGLPPGTYRFKVPKGTGPRFVENLTVSQTPEKSGGGPPGPPSP